MTFVMIWYYINKTDLNWIKYSNEIQSVHFGGHISRWPCTRECFIWQTRPPCPPDAPDIVGAALTRTADTLVCQGKEIPDAQSCYQLLKEISTVKLYYVSEEEVEKKDEAFRQVPLFTIHPQRFSWHSEIQGHQLFLPGCWGGVWLSMPQSRGGYSCP